MAEFKKFREEKEEELDHYKSRRIALRGGMYR